MAKQKGGTTAVDEETGELVPLEKAITAHSKAHVARELKVSVGLVDRWRSGDAKPTEEELAKLELLAEAAGNEPREGTDSELGLVTRLRGLAEMTQTPAWTEDVMPYLKTQMAHCERQLVHEATGGDIHKFRGQHAAYEGLLGFIAKQAKELHDLPLFAGKVSAVWNPKTGVLTVSDLKAPKA